MSLVCPSVDGSGRYYSGQKIDEYLYNNMVSEVATGGGGRILE